MASAQKKRDRKFPQAEFEVPLVDAVAALIPSNEIAAGDQWHFHVDGTTLQITRMRAPEDTPGNGPQNQSNARGNR